MRRRLRELGEKGYLDQVKLSPHKRAELGWFLSKKGREMMGGDPRSALSPERAVSQLTNHTLAANEIGLLFAEQARAFGDGYTVQSWSHEQHYYYRPGESSQAALIADAAVEYLVIAEKIKLHHFFVEIDRGTDSYTNVAAKAIAYARLAQYKPTGKQAQTDWRDRYSRFPTVLFVFVNGANQDEAKTARRLHIVRAIAEEQLQRFYKPHNAKAVKFMFAQMSEISSSGLFAPIWIPLRARDQEKPTGPGLLIANRSAS